MAQITASDVNKLRGMTGVSMMECKKALVQTDGDLDAAVKLLRELGIAVAAKRAEKAANQGIIAAKASADGAKIAMVEVNCETDFVAKSESFKELSHEIALQIAAASPTYVNEADIPADVLAAEEAIIAERVRAEGKKEAIIPKIVEGFMKKYKDENVLLNQKYIRDENKTINDLINDKVAALGERIVVRRFVRWSLGETTKASATEEQA